MDVFLIVALLGLLSCALVQLVGWALSMGWAGKLWLHTGPCTTTSSTDAAAQTALALQLKLDLQG